MSRKCESGEQENERAVSRLLSTCYYFEKEGCYAEYCEMHQYARL